MNIVSSYINNYYLKKLKLLNKKLARYEISNYNDDYYLYNGSMLEEYKYAEDLGIPFDIYLNIARIYNGKYYPTSEEVIFSNRGNVIDFFNAIKEKAIQLIGGKLDGYITS